MPKLHPLDRLAMEEYADGLSGIPAGPKLTARQSLCPSGLPRDGSFAARGAGRYSTYCALESRGLVKRRRAGTGFEWALNYT